ncbi:MAG: DUF4296 domain-containing protein [Flavobacterium sp.]|nr:MAG: DUF4296 domain-containing protein [Flavobacterium sp.]
MRKYITLFFSALVILCACNRSPKGVIDEEEMISLLVDVHITDGSLGTISSVPDTLYKYGTGKFLAVFTKHHTDSTTFNKSYKYYTSEPELFVTMYEAVEKKIQAKSDSLNKVFQKQNAGKGAFMGKPGHAITPDTAKNKSIKTKDSITLPSKRARVLLLKKRRDSLALISKKAKRDTIKKNK